MGFLGAGICSRAGSPLCHSLRLWFCRWALLRELTLCMMSETPIDITDWEWKPWFSTGGTRAKKYVEDAVGKLYYFKQSEKKAATETKPEKEYRYEFWSEIIASRIGKLLDFDVLAYEPALDGDVVGCLCEDMIVVGKEELIGGVQYLQGFDPSFEPALKEHRGLYTFSLIESALQNYGLQEFLPQIVEMLVFDAVLGNVDRHQENWAIISAQTPTTKDIGMLQQGIEKFKKARLSPEWKDLPKLIRLFADFIIFIGRKTMTPNRVHQWLSHPTQRRFAPLFDNGSSLGRELTIERIETLLADERALLKYIANGKSEVHWEQHKKPGHFELLEQLCTLSHRGIVINVIARIREQFDGSKIVAIIEQIDATIPDTHASYRMPAARKALVARLITLRCEKLYSLLPSS